MHWFWWVLATGIISLIMFLYGETKKDEGYREAVKDLMRSQADDS
jgi:hypothetical protein